jgi:uncharacterized damage-inducible protein DinB
MFRTVKDFLSAWKYEAEMTGKVLANLTDESLGQKVTPEGRTLGFLAWHIAQTHGEMMGLTGLKVDSPVENSDCPNCASDIAVAYERSARSVAEQVAENWTDETLLETDNMYGETWKRGFSLFLLVTHEAHHRGQMTVLMRQAGLTVPGVYGPAKEEWAAIGAPTRQ